MKALVTGSGGFIGSHLVELLLEQGWDVRAMLRYTSYPHLGNLNWLSKTQRKQLEIVRGDLKDPAFCTQAVKGCEVVFNLAALISIPFSYRNPTDFVQTNVLGTTHLLNAALQENQLQRFVQVSSSEVYGTAQYLPISENHPLQPQSPYAATKVGADSLAQSYHLSFDLPVTLIRPFNTYGPRQSTRAVIPYIILQLLQAEEIRLGRLEPKRDFLYVKDTVLGMLEAGLHAHSIGQVLNLGTGSSISIGDLYDTLCSLAGKKLPLKTDPQKIRPPRSEVMALEADASLAKTLTGWQARYSLQEGLQETLSWYEENLTTLNHSESWV